MPFPPLGFAVSICASGSRTRRRAFLCEETALRVRRPDRVGIPSRRTELALRLRPELRLVDWQHDEPRVLVLRTQHVRELLRLDFPLSIDFGNLNLVFGVASRSKRTETVRLLLEATKISAGLKQPD